MVYIIVAWSASHCTAISTPPSPRSQLESHLPVMSLQPLIPLADSYILFPSPFHPSSPFITLRTKLAQHLLQPDAPALRD